MLVCLSPKEYRLPPHTSIRTFTPEESENPALDREFGEALRNFYPSNPPFPYLTNPLIAGSVNGESRPDVGAVVYHVPKWIIPTSHIISIRSIVRQPPSDPNTKKARTFIVRTRLRDYTLLAPTADEFRRWTFLLSRVAKGADEGNNAMGHYETYPPRRGSGGVQDGVTVGRGFEERERRGWNDNVAGGWHPSLDKVEVWRRSVWELVERDRGAIPSFLEVGRREGDREFGGARKKSVVAEMGVQRRAPSTEDLSVAEREDYVRKGVANQVHEQSSIDPPHQERIAPAVEPHSDGYTDRYVPTPPPQLPLPEYPKAPTPLETPSNLRESPIPITSFSDPSSPPSQSHPVSIPDIQALEDELMGLSRVPPTTISKAISIPDIQALEDELMGLERVPAAETLLASPQLQQELPLVEGEKTDVPEPKPTMDTQDPTPHIHSELINNCKSVLRLISHLRGEFIESHSSRKPRMSEKFDKQYRNTALPIYLRLIEDYVGRYLRALEGEMEVQVEDGGYVRERVERGRRILWEWRGVMRGWGDRGEESVDLLEGVVRDLLEFFV